MGALKRPFHFLLPQDLIKAAPGGKQYLCLFFNFPGTCAEGFPESTVEGGVIREPTVGGGLGGGGSAADEPGRVHQPLLPDVLVYCAARLGLKQPHEVVTA